MDAVAGITQRVLQIQAQIARLDGGARGSVLTMPSSAQASTAVSGTTGTTGAASPSGLAFSAALGQAVDGFAFPSPARAARTSAGAVGAVGQAGAAGPAGSAGAVVPGYGKALVDAKGVPIELKAYGNGRVPASALGTIAGTGHRLWTPAARSFEALRAAAAKDGVTIGITDSYRTYESQVDLVRRKGLYSEGGLAAKPGTSNHGWGTALDLRLDPAAQSWMRRNAKDYGFVEDVPREPWHWHYVPIR